MDEIEVTVHDTAYVLVKRKGSSALTEARIIGVECEDEVQTLYLDRLVHKPHEKEMGGYQVSGAISSILKRRVQQ